MDGVKLDEMRDVEKLIHNLEHRPRDLRKVIRRLRDDVAERQETAQRLQQSEERLKMALDAAGIGIWDWDLVSGKLYWSENHAIIFGIELKDFGNSVDTFYNALHPDDRAQLEKAVEAARENHSEFHANYRIIRKGEIRYLSSTGRFHYDEQGKSIRMLGTVVDVTDREIGRRVRESEANFRSVFENATEVIFKLNLDGELIMLNPAWTTMTGYPVEQCMGKSLFDFLADDPPRHEVGLFSKLLRGEKLEYHGEMWGLGIHGKKPWFEINAHTIYNEKCELLGVSGTIIDRSPKKLAEEALRASEERYRAYFNNTAVGSVQVDLSDGRFLNVNQKYCDIVGYSREELLQMRFSDVTHPDDRQADWEIWKKFLARTIPMYFSRKRYIRKDGSIVWVDINAALVYDASGNPIRTAGVAVDVTKQIEMERKLRESEEQYRAFFNTEAVGAVQLEVERGGFLRVNQKFCEMTGYSEEELLKMTIADVTHKDDVAADVLGFAEFRAGKRKVFMRRKRYIRKDARVVWVDVSAAVIRDHNGKAIYSVGIIRDISKTLEAEERLRYSEERLRLALEAANKAIWEWHIDDDLVAWSENVARVMGIPKEMLGRDRLSYHALIHPDDLPDVRKCIQEALRDHTTFDCEYRLRQPSGQWRWVASIGRAFYEPDGKPYKMMGALSDITAKKEFEVALQTAKQQAESASRAKDEFFATVSHELRSPLTAILGWSELLKTGALDPRESKEAIDLIERSAKAEAQLVQDMLDVGRITSGKLHVDKRPTDLTKLVHQSVEAMRPVALQRNIALTLHADLSKELKMMGDETRLQQVVSNLLTNSMKFTPHGGKIDVHLAKVNDRVRLSVTDTGCGIERQFLPKVFDRLAQAEDAQLHKKGGLGLGLHIVKSIVELHDGMISASSPGKDKGATFNIELPLMV